MSVCARAESLRLHERHRPERTVLHAIVREHLPAFVRHADEHYARPLPRYVRRAFEQYLRCGIPEHGFLRVRCEDCGHDRVVAFSCKERGTCPSCAGRTMSNTAAHLVDRVLPNVPIRQWVLSLPFELRALAAKHPDVVSQIDRILFREVERYMQRASGPTDGRAGAVTFVQRFGGSLNLNVHFHVLFLEGLFTREGDALPVFHPALSPTRTDLLAVLTRVRDAVNRWLARRGLDQDPNTDSVDTDAGMLDACARVALQPGLFDKLDGEAPLRGSDADPDEPASPGRHSVALDGFNLHAAVTVGADDDVARERLARYCARPPFALERLSQLPDGRIAYRIKQPRRNATHRILEPIELLARIATLIPPPRHPFLRYHGVLAPASKWRRWIVPRLEEQDQPVTSRADTSAAPPAVTPSSAPPREPSGTSGHATPLRPVAPRTASPLSSDEATQPSPSRGAYARITAAHRERLGGGELLARTPRLEWSKLLRRTFACEVLVCPRCSGPARVLAAIHEPSEARRFLDALDQRSIPTTLLRSRVGHDDHYDVDLDDDRDVDRDVDRDFAESGPASEDLEPPPPSSDERPPPSSRPEAPPPDT